MASSNIFPLVFNHIAFPPKLPLQGESEEETIEVQKDLTRRLLCAIDALQAFSEGSLVSVWRHVKKLLESCSSVNGNGFVNKGLLSNIFQELKAGDAVPLYIGQQNACLFIRKNWQASKK